MGRLLAGTDRVATLHTDAAHGHLRQKRKILPISKKISREICRPQLQPFDGPTALRSEGRLRLQHRACEEIARSEEGSWSCSRDVGHVARQLVLGDHVDVFAGVERDEWGASCVLGVHTTLEDARDFGIIGKLMSLSTRRCHFHPSWSS